MKQKLNEVQKLQKIAGILKEAKYYPADQKKWDSMTVDQQNQIIDRMNKDLITGPLLVKFDKKKDYDNLNSDFYDDLHLYL